MSRIIVYHGSYGCETGCCGHWVEVDGTTPKRLPGASGFSFSHPYGDDDRLAFAKELVAKTFGPEHVADLDWENSIVSDD